MALLPGLTPEQQVAVGPGGVDRQKTQAPKIDTRVESMRQLSPTATPVNRSVGARNPGGKEVFESNTTVLLKGLEKMAPELGKVIQERDLVS